jgi:hypothetical protein
MSNYLPVVHIVDTEGVKNEQVKITFQRIYEMFGVKIKPTKLNFNKILKRQIKLPFNNLVKKEFYKAFNKNTLKTYNSTWKKIDHQSNILFKKSFRNKYKDSFGDGWIVNWSCVDHVNYKTNPQSRAIGFHKIFDYYERKIKQLGSTDNIYFHFHPTSLNNAANKSGNHYFSTSNNIFQILCRRIIERNWFPSVYRPGFHIERPDSHWFLEQYIPFDYGNQSYSGYKANGYRFENWDGATKSWSPYHPSYEDYRKKGNCKRWIARCLNIGARLSVLNQKEVNKAFVESKKGKKVILAFTNHDEKNMLPDFDKTYEMLTKASKRFKTKFKYFDARNAFRSAMKLKKRKKLDFKIIFKKNFIEISSNHETFGVQPYLAIRDKKGKFYHENFSIIKPYRKWNYYFDSHSLPLNKINTFGFASNDDYGNTTIVKINVSKKIIKKRFI